ncbi:MAG: sugar phosphate isomerase/epimerase [Clostridia bacterium]|nr:sugar phosphate isomerase/epimerase [Clostridia bacterium]
MKLSMELGGLLTAGYDEKTAISMVKEAGFDCYDHTLCRIDPWMGEDYRERALEIRRFAEELGIPCNQAHAPFYDPVKFPQEFGFTDAMEDSDPKYARLIRSIEVASILGAKNIVVHAVMFDRPEGVDFHEYNRRFYRSLVPYCEKFGICVSVENLFERRDGVVYPVLADPQELQDLVRSIDSPWINICVDVGHAGITGLHCPQEFLRAMDGSLLKALHVHDNDCDRDWHLFPYSGRFKWDEIAKALAEIGYTGDFTYETLGQLLSLDKKMYPAGMKYLEQIGRLLIEKIEEYRK